MHPVYLQGKCIKRIDIQQHHTHTQTPARRRTYTVTPYYYRNPLGLDILNRSRWKRLCWFLEPTTEQLECLFPAGLILSPPGLFSSLWNSTNLSYTLSQFSSRRSNCKWHSFVRCFIHFEMACSLTDLQAVGWRRRRRKQTNGFQFAWHEERAILWC